MRIRLAVPDDVVSGPIIEAALEAVTRTNEALMERGGVPPLKKAIRDGLRWKPEPPGDEHFDLATTAARRKWGDCDDLAPYRAAELRVHGVDPDARATVYKSGPQRWHVVVKRGDGQIEDPSRWAGMGHHERPAVVGDAGVCGLVQPLMASSGRCAFAAVPWRGGWAGRCDLPWNGGPYAVAANAWSPSRLKAVQAAVQGACVVGEASGAASGQALSRAMIADAIMGRVKPEGILRYIDALEKQGLNVDDLHQATALIPQFQRAMGSVVGDEIGFLPMLASAVMPMADKLTGGLAGKLTGGLLGGGGGGKKPAAAPPPAPPHAPPGHEGHGGGGGGGREGYGPNGPIIIRF